MKFVAAWCQNQRAEVLAICTLINPLSFQLCPHFLTALLLVLPTALTSYSTNFLLSPLFHLLLPLSLFSASLLSMSYLANAHRNYDSPETCANSHSQLPAQNARNIVNLASFDTLSAQHAGHSPDHRLPKVGETRCCQYSYYCTLRTIDRSIILYIPPPFLLRVPVSLSADALPPFSGSDWTVLSSDLHFVYLDPVFSYHLLDQADLLIGRPLLAFVHPDDRISAKNDLGNVIRTKALHGSVTWYALFLLPRGESRLMVPFTTCITHAIRRQNALYAPLPHAPPPWLPRPTPSLA